MAWNDDYNAACMELRLAEEEYRLADDALARATARVREAQRKCADLFRERIQTVNALQ